MTGFRKTGDVAVGDRVTNVSRHGTCQPPMIGILLAIEQPGAVGRVLVERGRADERGRVVHRSVRLLRVAEPEDAARVRALNRLRPGARARGKAAPVALTAPQCDLLQRVLREGEVCVDGRAVATAKALRDAGLVDAQEMTDRWGNREHGWAVRAK